MRLFKIFLILILVIQTACSVLRKDPKDQLGRVRIAYDIYYEKGLSGIDDWRDRLKAQEIVKHLCAELKNYCSGTPFYVSRVGSTKYKVQNGDHSVKGPVSIFWYDAVEKNCDEYSRCTYIFEDAGSLEE